jgi:nicotinamide-nucleotide amidase
MAYTSSILAIGSELLSGQILNRNAQWLSQKLLQLGFTIKQHLTVDDEHQAIITGIEKIAADSDHIFITGGLGPTTDDITRDAVSLWVKKELVYDPSSWTHIEEMFAKFQRAAPETNKQQCYFPEGAEILRNRAGTANGFHVQHFNKDIWVLPGPPKEVEAVWNDHVFGSLQSMVPEHARFKTKMWRTIGLGESHLAEILNPIVLGVPVTVAYRAHAPYVETKITYLMADLALYQPLLTTVEQALKKWMFEVDEEDTASALGRELNRFSSVDIYDGVTQGQLSLFLAPHIQASAKVDRQVSLVMSWEKHDSPRQFVEQCFKISGSSELALAVTGFDEDGKWAFGIRSPELTQIIERKSIYTGDAMRQRNQMAIAALTIKGWLDLMGQEVN